MEMMGAEICPGNKVGRDQEGKREDLGGKLSKGVPGDQTKVLSLALLLTTR